MCVSSELSQNFIKYHHKITYVPVYTLTCTYQFSYLFSTVFLHPLGKLFNN